MQLGVLIKSGGVVIKKEVYGGDLSQVEPILISRGVDFEIYSDTDPEFVNAVVGE